jgi:hypothetical protein
MILSTRVYISAVHVFGSKWYLVYLISNLKNKRLISPQKLDALDEVRPGLLQVTGDTNLLCALDALETQMFMMPTAVTMTIAATRMYRDLSDFCFHTDVCVILPFY